MTKARWLQVTLLVAAALVASTYGATTQSNPPTAGEIGPRLYPGGYGPYITAPLTILDTRMPPFAVTPSIFYAGAPYNMDLTWQNTYPYFPGFANTRFGSNDIPRTSDAISCCVTVVRTVSLYTALL